MRDETLVRLLEDTCKKLEGVHFPVETPHLAPTYNALLSAAQANHPGDSYLSVLAPLAADAQAGPEELNVLFGQLRIVLEALVEEGSDQAASAAENTLSPSQEPGQTAVPLAYNAPPAALGAPGQTDR